LRTSTQIGEFEKKIAELEKKKDPPPDPLEKADPEVRKRLEAAEAEAKASREEIAKMRAKQDRTEFIAKAGEFTTFGPADDFGPILQKISGALDEDELQNFTKQLRAHVAIAGTSDLLKEVGSGGEDLSGDPWAQIEKMADDRMQKSDRELSKPEAILEVCKTPEGKKLYAEYKAEMKGGK
jgi:O-acetyl-ADP-ribose deacetylase (regulator of RNase III)